MSKCGRPLPEREAQPQPDQRRGPQAARGLGWQREGGSSKRWLCHPRALYFPFGNKDAAPPPYKPTSARAQDEEMRSGGAGVGLISGRWEGVLQSIVSAARQDLLLACPFISRSATEMLVESLSRCRPASVPQVTCITNINASSVLSGALDLNAVVEMGQGLVNFRLFHLPSLHAKVYVADRHCAAVTSGNLTAGGLWRNCEYGVLLHDAGLVREVRHDFELYLQLAAQVPLDDATWIAHELAPLRAAFERAAGGTAAGPLGAGMRRAEERLLELRARGRSTHGIFCEAVVHLLRQGPLATRELHPQVQRLHPDICDDQIDRVIGGVNFGKRWKHHVRSAQQALKRAGRIEFDGQMWRLSKEAMNKAASGSTG